MEIRESGLTALRVLVRCALLMPGPLIAACHSPMAPGPAAFNGAPVARLDLIGPGTLSPGGEVAVFSSIAVSAEGATENVTALATWQTTAGGTLGSTGKAGEFRSGSGQGETTVTATYRGLSASRSVVVIQPGTFILGVRVLTPGGPSPPEASVRVRSGVGTSTWQRVRRAEYFRFFGVMGPVTLETYADGYGFHEFQTAVTEDIKMDLVMTPVTPALDISGSWLVALSASPACTMLPQHARERSYDATIRVLSAFKVELFLRGPTVLDRQTGQRGLFLAGGFFKTADTLVFSLHGPEDLGGSFVGGDLIDVLGPDEELEIFGSVAAPLAATEFQGVFAGDLIYRRPATSAGLVCAASDHRVSFWRR